MKRKVTRRPKPASAKSRAKTSAKKKGVKKGIKTRAKKGAAKGATTKHAPASAPQPDALDTLVSAGAQMLKLPLDPAWRGSVKFNLGLILRLGAVVDEFPLPDDAEPGPVFYA